MELLREDMQLEMELQHLQIGTNPSDSIFDLPKRNFLTQFRSLKTLTISPPWPPYMDELVEGTPDGARVLREQPCVNEVIRGLGGNSGTTMPELKFSRCEDSNVFAMTKEFTSTREAPVGMPLEIVEYVEESD